MRILVVTLVLSLWLHDCTDVVQTLSVLRQLRRGFCMIVLHYS